MTLDMRGCLQDLARSYPSGMVEEQLRDVPRIASQIGLAMRRHRPEDYDLLSLADLRHSPNRLFSEVAAKSKPGGDFLLGVPNCVNLGHPGGIRFVRLLLTSATTILLGYLSPCAEAVVTNPARIHL